MAQPPPIAVVGMGCRLPGGASTPEKLWDLLKEGRSGQVKVPKDRWNAEAFFHPDPEQRESLNAQSSYFLKEDISHFDARFFNCTPSEAHTMDPQGRLLLETSYEALESAGIPLESLKGSDTSVFAGVFGRDYDRMGFKDLAQISRAHLTGTGEATLSNRISYIFDLKGASMTIDTGCSASMAALHQACLTLRAGESRVAIVGGAELLIHPDQSITMSATGMVNPDGKCYVFDSRGSGYARGEGAAAVVLKLLDNAIADGDPIHGVIVQSALNQDGKTAGISLPNPDAQADLMRQVYASAGVDPGETLYVEAHGTGTQAGDNAEVGSISKVFCDESKSRKTDLYLGSVKSNIGHLEAASGVAGLIKTILVLKKGQVPPHLDLETPKPSLKLDERRIKVPQELLPLAPKGHTGPQRASVNSFGYGGTNCHVVLESTNGTRLNGVNGYHADTNGHFVNGHNGHHKQNGIFTQSSAYEGPLLFTLTAASETAANSAAKNLQEWLAKESMSYDALRNLSYTLNTRRSLLAWRSAFVASNQTDLSTELGQGKAIKSKAGISSIQTAFVFTGQGAQWYAMGRELMNGSSIFRQSLDLSDHILRSRGCKWSLLEELTKPEKESLVGRSEISQPATTAIQLALVDLLADIGIVPKAVVGHSSGEIAAAYAAGALTHEAAMIASYCRGVISARAKKMNSVPGSMLAVGSSEEAIAPLAKQAKCGKIRVACVNSPDSVTVSGDEAAIDELREILESRDIFARKLKVDTAYHSHHMETIAKDYLAALSGMTCEAQLSGKVSFYSSVTGQLKTSGFDASYWTENLVSQVRFSDALNCLADGMSKSAGIRDPSNVYVEIGPHAALMGPIRQILAQKTDYKYTYASCLHRNKDASITALTVAARLFELGSPVDFQSLLGLDLPRESRTHRQFKTLSDLPTYAFDHGTRYWYESRLSRDHRLRQFPYHDLVGLLDVASNIHEPRWRYHLSVKGMPWLKHHVVDGMIVFPGAGYATMALEAMAQLTKLRNPSAEITGFVLRDVTFSKPVVLKEEGLDGSTPEVELQLVLTRSRTSDSSPWEAFRVLSYDADGSWSEHSTGLIMAQTRSSTSDEVEGILNEQALLQKAAVQKFREIERASSETLDSDDVYSMLRSTGNDFGPSFSTLSNIKLSKDCLAHATMTIPDISQFMPKSFLRPHLIHPATLDAINQMAAVMFKRECSNSPLMPVFMSEITISANINREPGSELIVALEITPEGKSSASGNSWCYQRRQDGNLDLVATTHKWQLRAIGEEIRDAHSVPFQRKMNYTMQWDNDVDFPRQEQLQRRIHASVSVDDTRAIHDELNLNEKAAAIYLREAFQRVQSASDKITTPHLLKLYKWTENYLQSEMYRQTMSSIGSESEASVLQRLLKESGVEGRMLARIGENLPGILTGEVDSLALMLQGNLLNEFYADGMIRHSNTHMAKYMELLAFKKPRMAILEIGAGTGGSTLPLIQALDRPEGPLFDTYHYTDVSSGFFEKAKTKFSAWDSYMEYKTLDITRDPVAQGFEANKYDLIMCSNVLHATPSMAETISNTRKLLKPGGRLALVEITRLTAAINTIFGTLSGWWAFEDERIQGNHGPLLTRDSWHNLLSAHSFNGVEVAIDDHEGPAPRTSTMISMAVDTAPESQTRRTEIDTVQMLCTSPLSAASKALGKKIVSAAEKQGFRSTSELWNQDLTLAVQENTAYVVLDSAETSILASPENTESFGKLKTLLTTCKYLLWVSFQECNESPQATATKGLVTGFARVIRRENDSARFITLDIEESVKDKNLDTIVDTAMRVAETCFWPQPGHQPSKEMEYRLNHGGQLTIPRVQADTNFNKWIDQVNGEAPLDLCAYQDATRPLKLEVETPGLLSSLRFADDESHERPLARDEIQLEARAYGVNFRDVFIALGQMLPGLPMAGECAGVVTAVGKDLHGEYKVGDRVMGLGAQAFASHPRLKGHWAHALPSTLDLGFDAAASMPIIFLTAYHCLIDIAHLSKGQTVLIQAASGGVGQAAIQIAQWVGAEVFATVGSAEKRKLIMDAYGIPETHIFSSRNTSFKDGVLRVTKGRGVDVVLNSLAGEMLTSSWDCVAPLGFHLEIGKADIYKRSHLNMVPFDRSITFSAVDLLVLFHKRPLQMYKSFGEIVKLLDQGVLHAVTPLMTMDMDHVEQSFRLIAGRKHTGKVILNIPEHKTLMVNAVAPPPPSLQLDKNGTYVIAGGLGDLGRRIARVLAAHGAGHILSLSRRDLDASTKSHLEQDIRSLGAQLHIAKCDITDMANVKSIAAQCQKSLPPVKGVIHGGMVLRDHPLLHMSLDDYNTALGPKVKGTINLDAAFASPHLDFFIMLSSVTCILGKTGQANYSAGNAFQDAFAHAHRQQQSSSSGTRYISLNLGAVDGSEAIICLSVRQQELMRASAILMSFEEVFKVLEYAMGPRAVQDGCVQTLMGFDRQSIVAVNDEFSLSNPLLSMIPYTRASRGGAGGAGDGKVDVQASIKAAKSMKDAEEVIMSAIVKKFSVFLDRPVEDISLDQPLATFGMDSLVSIEVKNWMVRSFEVTISAAEVTGASSIPALAETIALRSKLIGDDVRGDASSSDQQASSSQDAANGTSADGKKASNNSNSKAKHGHDCCRQVDILPRQPIPDLQASLEYFISNASHFAKSPKELENLKSAVASFVAKGSTARQIYEQLAARAADSNIESWSSDVVTESLHLRPRFPLMHKSFSASHYDSSVPHSQAARAALIAEAAFRHKQALEAGEVEGLAPFGVPLCMYSSTWLFNATREPHIGCDQMRKYEGDYCVVLRHGRVFKVSLQDSAQNKNTTVARLEKTFQAILDESPDDEPDASIGLLTSDHRDAWAENREALLKIDPQNAAYLHTIDAAAFLVCLEDTAVHSASERVQQCIQGDGSNRWYDKCLQFIVAKNGTSSFIGEHSMLDGQSMLRLNEAIHEAIRGYRPGQHATNGTNGKMSADGSERIHLEEYTAVTSPELQEKMETLREKHRHMASLRQHAVHSLPSLNKKLFTSYNLPLKAIVDVTIQLASRLYFGHNPASWEPVNMARYHKARPDMIQQASGIVAAFCSAAATGASLPQKELRAMMVSAAEDINDNSARAARGENHYSLLDAIQAMWPAGEDSAAIFRDPLYQRAQPHRLISGITDSEASFAQSYLLLWPDALWMLYTPHEEETTFSIVGPSGGLARFEKCLDDAAGIIRNLVVS
ncbi:hypothetical protein M406DRAFT_80584 [Cryphonectria parasitica EP155]|uniref:Carrier domain-containing protein n=1 Tax=Cryphonectria parasitica (strain ATCC 38755 / EP155) TaxID=660469 RepID=A0A9P4Y7V3_CRYP1|nr:uncharacterized protein M406DRAFT_80584 [Cryphonectria parasitica EP155]KAF3768085.1 hypothetical protein M406DRAFT_80584 [Cryphonectria parasitica EP155]